MRIDCWDLDETILDRNRFFAPAIKRVAEVSGRSEAEVAAALSRVGKTTFTFAAWFRELGIAEEVRPVLEAELRADLMVRAPSCVYPGMRELLAERKRQGVRQVLISAGDPDYQAWKFDLLGLNDIFSPADRHFVPRNGSKAAVVAVYASYGTITVIDDHVDWLTEILDQCAVHCIRPRWPGANHAEPHVLDNQSWQVATTIEELHHLLNRGLDE